MNAPTVWPGTDLDSIVFGDEEQWPGCGFGECHAEAFYEGTFKPFNDVPCPHDRVLYCLGHKDQIMAQAGGLFHCRKCSGSEKTLIRMEPIR